MSVSLQAAREHGIAFLSESPSPQEDCQALLIHLTGLSPSGLIIHSDRLLSQDEYDAYQDYLSRRKQGEPIAHITGSRGFWTLDLAVNKHTLIPRPDTELLVQLALEKIQPNMTLIDIGTGTGAIALSIAAERKDVTILASDLVYEAIKLARENAYHHQLSKVFFIQMAWLNAVKMQCLDMVISNPPYIRETDKHLSEGDVRFEPLSALVSGEDGLNDIRQIVLQASRVLKPGGWCLIEHGYDQSDDVQMLFKQGGFVEISAHQDWGGQDRAVIARQPL